LRPELRTPPHSSKIDIVMEDISEKHVLFSPLWGRFPALDWEWGFSEAHGCLRGSSRAKRTSAETGEGGQQGAKGANDSKVLRCQVVEVRS
jgi:hypothetical protein